MHVILENVYKATTYFNISQLQAFIRSGLFHMEISSLTFRLHVSFLFVVAFILIVRGLAPTHTAAKETPSPLTSMLHVLTPAHSLWPQRYTRLSPQRSYLHVPLKSLIEDVIDGEIELRAPREDLPRLLMGNGRLDMNEYVLVLSVGLSLRTSMLWWWMKSTFFAGMYTHTIHNEKIRPESIFKIAERTETNHSPASCNLNVEPLHLPTASESVTGSEISNARKLCPGPMDHLSIPHSILPAVLQTLPQHILERLAVTTTLDSISLAFLETTLLAVPPRGVALLEFTTCDPHVSPGSTAWVLSVLPLALTSRVSRIVTLPGILALTESACSVISVQNVSIEYALLLADYARALEGGTGRKRFMAKHGSENVDEALRSWRAEKLWAQWAAACYEVGGLARWIVCVKRLPG